MQVSSPAPSGGVFLFLSPAPDRRSVQVRPGLAGPNESVIQALETLSGARRERGPRGKP